MAVQAVSSLISGTAVTTLSLNPSAIGNAFVLAVKLPSNTATVISISGGNCTWTKIAGPLVDTAGTAHTHYLYLGTATAAGSSTMTAALSTGTADLDAQQFTNNNTSTTWALDGSQDSLTSNSSSTTVTWPSLTPANPGELYAGHARCPNGASYSGVTSGFTEQTDANGNPFIYGTASAAVAPVLTSAATASYAIGALITASVSGQTIQSAAPVPAYAGSAGMSSFSLTSVAAGDIFAGYIEIDPSSSVSVTSLSSAHANWSKILDHFDADGKYYALFLGMITGAATDTVTISFSGSPGSSQVETGFQEFWSSRSTPSWSVTASGYNDYASGTVIAYPSLTPLSAGELYWGYGKTTATGSAGFTSGYSYSVVPTYVNVTCWNPVTGGSAQSPSAVTTTGSGVAIAALLADNVTAGLASGAGATQSPGTGLAPGLASGTGRVLNAVGASNASPGTASGTGHVSSIALVMAGLASALPEFSYGAGGYGGGTYDYAVTGIELTPGAAAGAGATLAYSPAQLITSPRLEGYGFGTFPQVPPGSIIESVVATIVQHRSGTGVAPPLYELWDGSIARIGLPQWGTVSFSTSGTDVITFTGVSYSQLATLRLRITGNVFPGSSSAVQLVDAISLAVIWLPSSSASATPVSVNCPAAFPAPSVFAVTSALTAPAVLQVTAAYPASLPGVLAASARPAALAVPVAFPASSVSIGMTVSPAALALTVVIPAVSDITAPGWAVSEDVIVSGTGTWANAGNVTGTPDGNYATWQGS